METTSKIQKKMIAIHKEIDRLSQYGTEHLDAILIYEHQLRKEADKLVVGDIDKPGVKVMPLPVCKN